MGAPQMLYVFCLIWSELQLVRYMYMQYAASLPEQQVPHSVSSAEMLKATSHEMHKHRGSKQSPAN